MDFIDEPGPPRVLLAAGAEARVADELAALGARRVLLVATAAHRDGADRIARALGDRCVGVFAGAEAQVPFAVAEAARAEARRVDADWVVAHGGGTPIGVAKAVALDVDVKVAAVPTTYSGSEMTDIWGITRDGVKTTGRDERVRPALVVYDPELVAQLRPEVARTSLYNALAHSVDALYDDTAPGEVHDRAEASVRAIVSGLRALQADPRSVDAASRAQHGAHLAAWVLSRARMAIHHKLAHTLGGSFGLPHGETHTALLPFTLAFNQAHAPGALARLRRALSAPDPAAFLWELAESLGMPTALGPLGFALADIPRAVDLSLRQTYANPRTPTVDGLEDLLQDAVLGRKPSLSVRRQRLDGAAGVHADIRASLAGAPLEGARAVVLVVHGRGALSDKLLERVRGVVEDFDVAFVAPQGSDRTWYAKGFLDVEAIEDGLTSAASVLEAAWRLATSHVPPERVLVVGFSQGACLALSWLSRTEARPGAVIAWSGAASPGWDDYRDLGGLPVYVGTCLEDPWLPIGEVERTVRALVSGGAEVDVDRAPGSVHEVRPADLRALHRLMEVVMTGVELHYQSGYGNALASEARPGALPQRQNGPRKAPYGLYAEQINGTGFTVKRAENRRVWMYRLRPQIATARYERVPSGRFAGRFDDGVLSPNLERFAPVPMPTEPTTFLEGVTTFAGAGDPALKAGMAIHLYAANADMVDQAFCDIDGDLLVVPQEGALLVRTELGLLHVRPGEILVLPRGIRFSVALPDGASRGFFSELFDGHHLLPERGPVGANGLADERHFQAPVADFEDRAVEHEVFVKQGGELWRTVAPASPFDVVAWHGDYAPFKYDLMDFTAYWSVTVDHSDPSILTVLTCPRDASGRNALDFAVFRGRWDTTEHTFRPPYLHRNSAIEFNAVIKGAPSGPYRAGAFTYTPYLALHGVSVSSHAAAVSAPDEVADAPRRLSDDELWIQWESTYQLKLMPWMLDDPGRDDGYLDQFQGFPPARV